jgi:hypothetical protein
MLCKNWRDNAHFAQSTLISRAARGRFDGGMEVAEDFAARRDNVDTIKHTRSRNHEKQGEQFEEI